MRVWIALLIGCVIVLATLTMLGGRLAPEGGILRLVEGDRHCSDRLVGNDFDCGP